MSRPRVHRTRRVALGFVAAVAVALPWGTATPAAAAPHDDPAPPAVSVPPGTYRILARADAMRVQFTDPGAPAIPQGRILNASPSTAQALVDSTGVSEGFAAAPTPGEEVAALPLVVNGLTAGQAPPLPGYPFVVNSTYPGVPSQQEAQGPYSVSSVSDENTTTAAARIGVLTEGATRLGSSNANVSSVRDPATGTITATADASTDGLQLSPLITLGEISAHVQLVAEPGKAPTVEKSFSVGSLTVAGVRLGLTDKGLEGIPGLALSNIDLSILNGALKQANLSIEYLPGEETPTSVDSGGLAITFAQDLPSQGLVNTTVTLGRVMAIAEDGPLRVPHTAVATPSTPAAAPVAASTRSPVSATPARPGVVTPAPQRSASVVAPPVTTDAGFDPAIGGHWAAFYLAIVGGALACLASSRIFSFIGLRLGVARPTGLPPPPAAMHLLRR